MSSSYICIDRAHQILYVEQIAGKMHLNQIDKWDKQTEAEK